MTKAPEVVWWGMWGLCFKQVRRLSAGLTLAVIISTLALCNDVGAADVPFTTAAGLATSS